MIKNILQTHLNKTAFKITDNSRDNREKLKIRENDMENQNSLEQKLEQRKNCKDYI